MTFHETLSGVLLLLVVFESLFLNCKMEQYWSTFLSPHSTRFSNLFLVFFSLFLKRLINFINYWAEIQNLTWLLDDNVEVVAVYRVACDSGLIHMNVARLCRLASLMNPKQDRIYYIPYWAWECLEGHWKWSDKRLNLGGKVIAKRVVW